MSYHGDIAEDATIDFKFTSRDSTGLPTTLSGTPALSVYKSNGTTQSTAGITLSADFDSVTGLNHVNIDTSSDAFYAAGEDYDVVITTGTVDSISVVGEVVGSFSVENRSVEEIRTNVAAVLVDTGTTIPGTITTVDTVVDGIKAVTDNLPNSGALTDLATAAALATVDSNVDAILVDTGTTLPGTLSTIAGYIDTEVAAILEDTGTTIPGLIATAQADLDILTGTDGATLAASQPNYAPAKAGDEMDLVDAPNATAVSAIQNGLATPTNITAGTITTTTNLTNLPSIPNNWITAAGIASGALTATKFAAGAFDAVWSVAARVLTAGTNIVLAKGTGVTGFSDPSAADVADAVWTEAIGDHSETSGSTAEQLAAAGAGGDPWATALPGAYTSGQAGKIVGDNLNATVSSRASQTSLDTVDDIVDTIAVDVAGLDGDAMRGTDNAALATTLGTLVTTVGAAGAGLTEAGGTGDHLTAINLPNQTMDITGDITGNLSGSVGSVTGAVGSVAGNVGGSVASVTGAVGSVAGNVGGNVAGSVASVTGNVGGNVTGSVGSLATQAKADVNAEVDSAISDAALATAANLATVDNVADTIKLVTDKLDDTLEDDAGTNRFTQNALEQAPAGGGGGDATEDKQDTILAKMLAYFRLTLRKDAAVATDDATELTAINADSGSGAGAYSNQTEALEALQAEHDASQTSIAAISTGAAPNVLQTTTIATLASQTSFTLSAGSSDDNAYDNALVIVTDASTNTQKCVGEIDDYTGATKTVTLKSDPGIFTMASGDAVTVVAVSPTLAEIFADTDALGAASINVVSPIAETGEIEIVRGDDYHNTDGRAIDFVNASGTWPDLEGATVAFTAKQGIDGELTKSMTVVTASGANQTVRLELTAEDTTVKPGKWSYDVQATLSNERIVTLQRKQNGLTVLQQYTD